MLHSWSQYLEGCLVGKPFACSAIEALDGSCKILGGDVEESALFGAKFAQQAVPILIRAALSGRVGIGEINLAVKRSRNSCVSSEFKAVVKCHGFDQDPERLQCADDCIGYAVSVFGFDPNGQANTCFALDEGHERAFVIAPHHGVAFPETEGRTLLNGWAAGLNAYTIGNSSAFVPC